MANDERCRVTISFIFLSNVILDDWKHKNNDEGQLKTLNEGEIKKIFLQVPGDIWCFFNALQSKFYSSLS